MSSVEEAHLRNFLHRLTTAGKEERLTIIRHLSPRDCRFIRQVVYNILFNSSLDIKEKDRIYFRRNIGTLRILASRGINAAEKRLLLGKRHLLLKRLVIAALSYLEQP